MLSGCRWLAVLVAARFPASARPVSGRRDGPVGIRNGSGAFYAAAGSFVFLPRGRPHGSWAPGRPARLVIIAVPDGIEDYFRKFIATATEDERHRVGERYRIRVVPG